MFAKNMITVSIFIIAFGGITSAIGVAMFQHYNQIKSEEGARNASNERKNIESKIDSGFKEVENLYKKRLEKFGLEYSQKLQKKYPYGYILFGILDSAYIQGPVIFDTKLKIVADWEKIEIRTDPNNKNYYLITLNNFQQSKPDKNSFSGVFVGSQTFAVPKNEVGYEKELTVVHLENEARIFFELIDDSVPNKPVFVIGFRK